MVEMEDSLVTLLTMHPDTSKIFQKLVLVNTGSDLPKFSSYSQLLRYEDTPWTMIEGTIAIQTFDISGVMSGKITGDLVKGSTNLGLKVDSPFWVDLSASGSE